MKRTRLQFENIQKIMGSDDMAVVLLTDEERRLSLSVVCDEPITHQILMRLQNSPSCASMLPEALMHIVDCRLEMMVYAVHDGQYQVVLCDTDFHRDTRIRMSDAVLLSIIAGVPLYIEDTLLRQQASVYDENARGVGIPINTMDVPRLHLALQKAIDEENYELASQLRDELRRRSGSQVVKGETRQ